MDTTKKTIVVFSGDLDKAMAAFIIANGAAAMGDEVTMFFTYWGLNMIRKPEKVKVSGKSTLQSMFGRMMPRGAGKLKLSQMNFAGMGVSMMKRAMKAEGAMSLEELLRAARETGCEVQIVKGGPVPPGWAGKVWAMHQGVTRGVSAADSAPYVLFSDADISHGAASLRELVSRAETGAYDLTSFMVRLESCTVSEKLMIPAFVFFFRMLYPFRLVNDPDSRVAGAAGGTMLVRRAALQRIGGLASIKEELIDDCALAREVKRGGYRIWLGMSETSRSLRHYHGPREIMRMISRSAYAQLGHSPVQLAACVAGMAVGFLLPPVLLLTARGLWPCVLGGAGWLMMGLLYLPMVRFYRISPLAAVLLPVAVLFYLWATLASAWHYRRGRGGMWKGRHQGQPFGSGS